MMRLCVIGLEASKMMRIRLQVLATPITCLPLPLPSTQGEIVENTKQADTEKNPNTSQQDKERERDKHISYMMIQFI